MAFILVTTEKVPSRSKPDQAPIFIFPGILGNGNEMTKVIQELSRLYPNRPIYAYYEPVISNHPAFLDKYSSLESRVEGLVASMQELFPVDEECHICPFIIVGYSYGCTLAALTAMHLKEQKEDALVYLIDGPSPNVSQAFFNDKKETNAVTLNLVNVINYAAKLSFNKNVTLINLPSEELDSLAKHDINYRIDNLALCLLLKNRQINSLNADREAAFKTYIAVMKKNIQDLIQCQTTPASLLIIKTLFTIKTLALYTSLKADDQFGGWMQYATSIENDSSLAHEAHLDLLNEKNAKVIAHSIDEFINQYMKKICLERQLHLATEQLLFLSEDKDFAKFNNTLPKMLSKIANQIRISFSSPSEKNQVALSKDLEKEAFIFKNSRKFLSSSDRNTLFWTNNNNQGKQQIVIQDNKNKSYDLH